MKVQVMKQKTIIAVFNKSICTLILADSELCTLEYILESRLFRVVTCILSVRVRG